MDRLAQLVRMKQDGHITGEEFERLKGEIVLRATDGT